MNFIRSAPKDLLDEFDVKANHVVGEWVLDQHQLTSPKAYGARIELPKIDLKEYQLTMIVEPVDEPNGFLLGAVVGKQAICHAFQLQHGQKHFQCNRKTSTKRMSATNLP